MALLTGARRAADEHMTSPSRGFEAFFISLFAGRVLWNHPASKFKGPPV